MYDHTGRPKWNIREEMAKLDADIKRNHEGRGESLSGGHEDRSSSNRVRFEEPKFNPRLKPKPKKAGIISKILAKFKQ